MLYVNLLCLFRCQIAALPSFTLYIILIFEEKVCHLVADMSARSMLAFLLFSTSAITLSLGCKQHLWHVMTFCIYYNKHKSVSKENNVICIFQTGLLNQLIQNIVKNIWITSTGWLLLIFSTNSEYDFDANGARPNRASTSKQIVLCRLLH